MACVLAAPSEKTSVSPPASDLLKNGSKMEQVANHLNYKNRESKLAQKDSTELFQTLYILQKTRRPGQEDNDDDDDEEVPFTETGIISEIRENGFFVFVPRFGIKGPVYLKEKSGDISVPLSALQEPAVAKARSSLGNKDHLTLIHGCQMDTDLMTQIAVKVPQEALAAHQGLAKMIQLRLFDKVKVALRLKKSHAHRHSIYMTLIGLDHEGSTSIRANVPKSVPSRRLVGNKDEVKRIAEQDPALAPFTERELLQGIQAGEEDKKKKKGRKVVDPEELYHQTRPEASLYSLIDAFDRFRIIESSSS